MTQSVSHRHPDTIYVKKQRDGGETYFITAEDVADLGELNEPILVSMYKRVSTHTLITKPQLQPEVSHHGSPSNHVRVPKADRASD